MGHGECFLVRDKGFALLLVRIHKIYKIELRVFGAALLVIVGVEAKGSIGRGALQSPDL